jgi:hypothetical protein
MCEYCGCQDVAAIGELTREHDLVADLIGEARSAYRDGDLPQGAGRVFPAALAELSTQAWETLDAVREGVGGILHRTLREH